MMPKNSYLCAAMRKREHMRTGLALLLLSVLLPMAIVLPFHHHETEEVASDSCEFCAEHRPHPGHLSAANCLDECLLCQFLAAAYLPAAAAETLSRPCRDADFVALPPAAAHSLTLSSLAIRAPPFSFC